MIYVVGAGLSIDAGVPGITDLQGMVHGKFDQDLVHGAAYHAALRQIRGGESPSPVSLGGIEDRRRRGTGGTTDFRLEELIDVLDSSAPLPGVPPEGKSVLRKAVMTTIGEGLNLGGTNPGPPRYFVRLIRRAIRLRRPVHIFSLNFDLCIELLTLLGYVVETGFGGYGPEYPWEKARFLRHASGAHVFLYKMHGSLNWRLGEDGRLYSLDPRGHKDIEEAVVVLGEKRKRDGKFPKPYRFYRGWFLKLATESRLVLVIGYSFRDPGINTMLGDFAESPGCDRICVLSKFPDPPEREEEYARIREILRGSDRVRFIHGTAENLSRGDYARELCSGGDFPRP